MHGQGRDAVCMRKPRHLWTPTENRDYRLELQASPEIVRCEYWLLRHEWEFARDVLEGCPRLGLPNGFAVNLQDDGSWSRAQPDLIKILNDPQYRVPEIAPNATLESLQPGPATNGGHQVEVQVEPQSNDGEEAENNEHGDAEAESQEAQSGTDDVGAESEEAESNDDQVGTESEEAGSNDDEVGTESEEDESDHGGTGAESGEAEVILISSDDSEPSEADTADHNSDPVGRSSSPTLAPLLGQFQNTDPRSPTSFRFDEL